MVTRQVAARRSLRRRSALRAEELETARPPSLPSALCVWLVPVTWRSNASSLGRRRGESNARALLTPHDDVRLRSGKNQNFARVALRSFWLERRAPRLGGLRGLAVFSSPLGPKRDAEGFAAVGSPSDHQTKKGRAVARTAFFHAETLTRRAERPALAALGRPRTDTRTCRHPGLRPGD
jgi:hypothetical protein